MVGNGSLGGLSFLQEGAVAVGPLGSTSGGERERKPIPQGPETGKLAFFLFFFSFFKNDWSIVDLQCCIIFSVQQSESVIHIHICILFPIQDFTEH